jgi:hypothetical protein
VADESAGFLGRWARRKADAREGKTLSEPPAQAPSTAVAPNTPQGQAQAMREVPPPEPQEPVPTVPALTLEDARALTPESNFSPFMARQVSPEVRNAAMKKLFADPHFNVMDGLDTYIDDYSLPDPLPASMLRQMASAQFLKLFEESPEEPLKPDARETADNPTDQTMAQSTPVPEDPHTAHDDPHLRLQPDHAAGPQSSGDGPA